MDRCGWRDSLGYTFEVLQAGPDILLLDRDYGVFVSYSGCASKNSTRVAAYLRSLLELAIERLPSN